MPDGFKAEETACTYNHTFQYSTGKAFTLISPSPTAHGSARCPLLFPLPITSQNSAADAWLCVPVPAHLSATSSSRSSAAYSQAPPDGTDLATEASVTNTKQPRTGTGAVGIGNSSGVERILLAAPCPALGQSAAVIVLKNRQHQSSSKLPRNQTGAAWGTPMALPLFNSA